jgi:hypothetical protein
MERNNNIMNPINSNNNTSMKKIHLLAENHFWIENLTMTLMSIINKKWNNLDKA